MTDLRRLLPEATQVDHIGSTSVPGLAAKDCIDLMVQVPSLDASDVGARLAKAGHRLRPEPWNREETSFGVTYRKQVFAPRVNAPAQEMLIQAAERWAGEVRWQLAALEEPLAAAADAAQPPPRSSRKPTT